MPATTVLWYVISLERRLSRKYHVSQCIFQCKFFLFLIAAFQRGLFLCLIIFFSFSAGWNNEKGKAESWYLSVLIFEKRKGLLWGNILDSWNVHAKALFFPPCEFVSFLLERILMDFKIFFKNILLKKIIEIWKNIHLKKYFFKEGKD